MMNVSYISKMNKLLGLYGPYDRGYMFEPVENGRINSAIDVNKNT